MDWYSLLRLYGFDVEEREGGTLLVESVEHYHDNPSESDYSNPNPRFFAAVLATLGLTGRYDESAHTFDPPGEPFSASAFLDAYRENHHNASSGTSHDLGVLEPHVARLVRAINGLGVMTTGSCEGHILSRRAGADAKARYFFKPGYIACPDYMQLTLTLLNPRLRTNQINEFVVEPREDASPEETAREFWGELNRTAEIIESDREKARELADAVKGALSLKDEMIRAYTLG